MTKKRIGDVENNLLEKRVVSDIKKTLAEVLPIITYNSSKRTSTQKNNK